MQIIITEDNKLKIVGHESDAQQLKKWREIINYGAASAQLVTYVGKGYSELVLQQTESDEMIEWKKSKPRS